MSTPTELEAAANVPIGEADVAGFAARLEAWYQTLPPGEQAVLQRSVSILPERPSGGWRRLRTASASVTRK